MVKKRIKKKEENLENLSEEKASDKKNLPFDLWKASTITSIVITIILISYIGLNYSKINSQNLPSVSIDVATKNLVDFAKSQGVENIEVVSKKDMGYFYNITVKVDGQETSMMVSKDGENVLIMFPLKVSEEKVNKQVKNNVEPKVEVPKSDKPVVELFVMSHCPFGTQAEKGIIPVFELLKDKIDSKIRFVNYAMHGKIEVYEQLNQYCIQKEQGDKFYAYLKCFLGKTGTEEDAKACLKEAKIDETKLKKCVEASDKEYNITKNYEDKSSWASGRFPLFKIDDALNKKYGVQGSPTLVINGVQVSSGRDSASYLKVICSAFKDPPKECSEKLSSSIPSPGFGYSTTTSNSAASCG